MTRSEWILAGFGGIVGLVTACVVPAMIQQPEGETLPAVSAGIPASDVIDLTDRDLIEKLLPRSTVMHYQFVDDDGEVRFVPTLTEVPLGWRNRAGFVEMAATPQNTPAEARMIRKLDSKRDRTQIGID